MNFTRSTFVMLMLVMLAGTGCSMVALGYNHADWILRYWITDYTSFNTQQKNEIHLEVDSYLRWHRNNVLPEYIALLQNLNTLISRDETLNSADVIRLRIESKRLYVKTMEPFVRPAAKLLSALDEQQIDTLRKTLDKKNRKEKQETLFASAQKTLGKRAERYIDFIEQLVGDLSDEQAEKIRLMSLNIPLATRPYIEQREAKQANLIALLSAKSGEDNIAEFLRQWIVAPEISRTVQQQQILHAHESAMNEMTIRIFELLSPRQKNHLRNKVSSYIDDFQKLAR